MQDPTISVLMPVHNGAQFIEEAVNSILHQDYRDFELLIIDDGSDDDTHAIAVRLASDDTRIRLHRQEKSGIVAALNFGIERSTGKYLARMDADDIAHPSRLGLQWAKMEAEPRLIACGTDIVKFGDTDQYVATPPSDEACKALLMIESCFAHPTVMLRADVIRQKGIVYRSDAEYVEDYRLWTDLVPYGDFANISQPLLRYRIHGGQVGSRRIERQRDAHVEISAGMLRRNGFAVRAAELKDFLWPSELGVQKAIAYLLSSYDLAKNINATAPDSRWLHTRTRRIRVRNTVKMAARKNA